MSTMWYTKLHEAKKAKSIRKNINKARLVKHTIVRLWGKTHGENWFNRSRWAQYDEPIQNRDHQYADLLVGNPYVSAEAARRSGLGVQFESYVRSYVHQLSVHSNNKVYIMAIKEAISRIERDDWVFEAAVQDLMDY